MSVISSFRYSFYVTKGRARRFLIEVCDGERTKTVMIGEGLHEALRFYSLLVENEVAPCHVDDVMEDMMQMANLLVK